MGHRLTQQGYPVTTIGKLHYRDEASTQEGFPDQRIPLHIHNGIGDLTCLVRDESVDRSWMRDELITAGEGDSDYIHYDQHVADLAIDYLKNAAASEPAEKPWCCYVGFVCPHTPWKVPKEFMDLYMPYDKVPFPIQWERDERPMHPALQWMRHEFCFDDPLVTDEVVHKAVAAYYGMISYVDSQIGRVLDTLRKLGFDKTTRIIYADDHGDTAGDHALFFKHNMYEGSVGVPLIMSGPGIPKGRAVHEPVSLVDIFPTVLESVGAQARPEDSVKPGISLYDYIEGNGDPDRVIFSEYHTVGTHDAIFMVRWRRYKLVYYVGDRPQLFDLEADPNELNDLAENPAYETVVETMIAKLREICDPEKVNAEAKKDQAELLEAHGGLEAAMKNRIVSCSPVPEGSV